MFFYGKKFMRKRIAHIVLIFLRFLTETAYSIDLYGKISKYNIN